MSKGGNRVTTTLDEATMTWIREWGEANNMRTISETLRALLAYVVHRPPDRATMMAYQQTLVEMRSVARELLQAALAAASDRIFGKGMRR